MREVTVVIGAGSIGQAITRRVGAGKHALLADLHHAAGVVISSQSGHRLGALTGKQNAALATTPADQLLALPMLQPDQVTDSLHAYQLAKRGNSLRVMAEAVRWGRRGARVNTISPGIIFTPHSDRSGRRRHFLASAGTIGPTAGCGNGQSNPSISRR